MKKTTLILKNNQKFEGFSFGAETPTSGEVVFNTGMVGYPEAFTDPSYRGQILVMTYPLIGNYGVPKTGFESKKIQIRAVIVQNYSFEYSHSEAVQSLDKWLKSEGIPGIYGVDTRAITKILRKHGVMLGQITTKKSKPLKKIQDPNETNLVAEVSCKKPKNYGQGKIKIIAVDCGMKENIIRSFVHREVRVKRVPWNYDYLNEKWDGLFISNGPGDPMMADKTIEYLKKAFKFNKPIFGICLGSQIMGLASGAKTYKLKYGHRAQNQPCLEEGTKRCYLTTQNHGYAVEEKTIPKDWQVWFRNANDNSIEGIRHKTKPFISVQFHPEASPGPTDTAFLFDKFIRIIKLQK